MHFCPPARGVASPVDNHELKNLSEEANHVPDVR